MTVTIENARDQCTPDGCYLNTASVGLPGRQTLAAVREAVDGWAAGTMAGPDFDPISDRCRLLYADLAGVAVDDVVIGSQAATLAGIIAASLPDDAEVLLASDDFTSVMFPFLIQRWRGVTVREAPLAELAEAISARTTLVAVSSAQSLNGALVDRRALLEARAMGVRVLLDLTQSAGWLPIRPEESDYTICSAYKWLMAPRGAAFLTVRPELREALHSDGASWYGGEDIWSSIYGSPLRLARAARGLDASPAWLSWAGLAPSLELITQLGVAAIGQHSVGLADRFRAELGMPPAGSAIVSVPVRDGAGPELEAAGIRAAMRAGRLRVAFYLYNDDNDLDQAVDTVRPLHISG